MAIEVLLPKLGLTMQEGLIEEWLVPAGHEVSPGDPILVLATDKVDVEVEAEAAGRLHPVVTAGTTLPPGALIAWLLAVDEQLPAATIDPVLPDNAPAPEAAGRAPQPHHDRPDRLFASPNARRLAAAARIDLATVRGTGPGGRIVSEDIDALPAPAPQPAAAADPVVAESGEPVDRVIPLTGMRGAIARRMHASLHEMAQLTHGFEANMDGVVALRAKLKREWTPDGLAVPSLNDFVVLAAARALLQHPGLNASLEADGIHLFRDIHVGVAVSVPDGLLVPVVRDAARGSLVDLAARIRTLAAAARAGRLALSQLEGATFVVSSLGGYGVDFFTPIVNPGNVAILGVGRLRDGVRWEDETPRRTAVLTLSLTFDHRAVDGAPAAEYLRTVAGILEQPLRLLAR